MSSSTCCTVIRGLYFDSSARCRKDLYLLVGTYAIEAREIHEALPRRRPRSSRPALPHPAEGATSTWVSNLFAGLKLLIWGAGATRDPCSGLAGRGPPPRLRDTPTSRADHAKPDIWSFVLRHDISIDKLAGLPYLRAVLMEGLRM
ncbi:hypothetical protein LY76DRAFT_606169 [Colletotrichum caudatum]|nr:hypothetical protein LY76DRAFT_606169 [Colletotrichum caudatum]